MEKIYQLKPGDMITVSGDWAIKNMDFFNNFVIIRKEYYPRYWYQWFSPRRLKSVTVMFKGEEKE